MQKLDFKEFILWENNFKKKDSFLDVGCHSGKKVLEIKCNCYEIDINKEILHPKIKGIKEGD